MTSIDSGNVVSQLRKLYETNHVAEAVFDWFSGRQKGARQTKARVAARRTGQEYLDIIELFRDLDEMAVGRFIVGRKGAESRIEWHYDVKSIASVARAEADEPKGVGADAPLDDDDSEPVVEKTMSDNDILHFFVLRPDLRVEVVLPSDLTSGEAGRFATWIKSLPFEE